MPQCRLGEREVKVSSITESMPVTVPRRTYLVLCWSLAEAWVRGQCGWRTGWHYGRPENTPSPWRHSQENVRGKTEGRTERTVKCSSVTEEWCRRKLFFSFMHRPYGIFNKNRQCTVRKQLQSRTAMLGFFCHFYYISHIYLSLITFICTFQLSTSLL